VHAIEWGCHFKIKVHAIEWGCHFKIKVHAIEWGCHFFWSTKMSYSFQKRHKIWKNYVIY